jgi:hypothetical protein
MEERRTKKLEEVEWTMEEMRRHEIDPYVFSLL